MVSANAWPFDDPPNCAVFVTRDVMDREEPILLATHEDGENSWSFIGTTNGTLENCRILALHEAAALDSSLFTLQIYRSVGGLTVLLQKMHGHANQFLMPRKPSNQTLQPTPSRLVSFHSYD